MSYVVRDSKTGEKRRRKRPITAITISPVLLAELDEIARKTGQTRSAVIEKCILYGIGRLRKEVEPPKEEEPRGDEGPRDETDEQRFMRKILFDFNDNSRWASV